MQNFEENLHELFQNYLKKIIFLKLHRYYVLQTYCKDRGPVSHVIVDILNQIEGKEFQIRDIKDTNFFVTAMDVCRNHLLDRGLAKRVDELLHVGDNYNLIGDSFKVGFLMNSTYYFDLD